MRWIATGCEELATEIGAERQCDGGLPDRVKDGEASPEVPCLNPPSLQ